MTLPEPTRAAVDRSAGAVLLEFGSRSCGHCRAAQPSIAAALAAHPQVQHIKVEDGKGLALGRSFAVKVWPTLIALRDGAEIGRLVRPGDASAIERLLARIAERS